MKKTKRSGTVHVDDRLPSKPPAPPAGKRVRSAVTTPPSYDGPSKTGKAPAPKSGGHAKPASGQVQRPRASAKPAEFGDQVPRKPPSGRSTASAAGRREQYIRLRVRVRAGRMIILDSHLVDGPLSQASGFSAANAYEITLGDRLLHAAALPDLGVQRSFVNPKGPPEQHDHYITERPIYEFTARVPAHEVTAETISKIALRLHRVKDEARTDRLGAEPLTVQFPREMRPIAELVGLPESVLPEAIEARGGRTPSR